MTLMLSGIIFAISALAGIAVRLLMLLFTIDPISGFLKTEYALPNLFIIIVLVVTFIVAFVTPLTIKTKSKDAVTINNLPIFISLVFIAAAIVFETFFSGIIKDINFIQAFVHVILTIASAVSLLGVAVFKLSGRPYPPIISLVPILFWIMRLIIVFTGFATISTISDTVIETLQMCLTLGVFLFFAKAESGLSAKHYKLFAATALACGIVSLTGSIPRAIIGMMHLLEKLSLADFLPDALKFMTEQPTHMNLIPFTTGIAVAFFSVVFAYSLLSQIKE